MLIVINEPSMKLWANLNKILILSTYTASVHVDTYTQNSK